MTTLVLIDGFTCFTTPLMVVSLHLFAVEVTNSSTLSFGWLMNADTCYSSTGNVAHRNKNATEQFCQILFGIDTMSLGKDFKYKTRSSFFFYYFTYFPKRDTGLLNMYKCNQPNNVKIRLVMLI